MAPKLHPNDDPSTTGTATAPQDTTTAVQSTEASVPEVVEEPNSTVAPAS
jgi:hypothetical protein